MMNNSASSSIIFEHPLNEKMRSWLRIEQRLQHLFNCNSLESKSQKLFFLHHLSNLLDILDRNDIRSDLMKDLERQQQKLAQWSDRPGVDMLRLDELQQQISHYITELMATPRLGQPLREDPFISSIRQRLLMPGGSYIFDVPVLHLWLHQSIVKHREQVAGWLTAITALHNALKLQLTLLRQSTSFQQKQATQGFYKEKIEEERDLLRLQITQQQNIFPQISAHKNYFAIRFLYDYSSPEKIPADFSFGLTCC